MNRTTKTIFAGLLFVSGAYVIYKYTPLPAWVRKTFFGENEISGAKTPEEVKESANKFPLLVGSQKQPEVAVVQLSLGTELTGTIGTIDIDALQKKYGADMQSITEEFYNNTFKASEATYKPQTDTFYASYKPFGYEETFV